MKARKIVLTNYEITVFDLQGNEKTVPYEVRKSLSDIILAPQLKLNGSDLVRNWKIADKIMQSGEYVLLEAVEFSLLKQAVDELKVFGKNDVELVKRVLGADEVVVDEKVV